MADALQEPEVFKILGPGAGFCRFRKKVGATVSCGGFGSGGFFL